MKLFCLKNYNNYYNRIIKVEQYERLLAYENVTLTDYNFAPGNEINTEIVINWDQDWMPNYIAVMPDDGTTILSRWFIIDHTRTREGQYICQLRRDLIADYYNPVINAQTFIEKATVGDDSNLIFNNENMSYNQVKSKEVILNDRTATAWIVGYLSNKRSTAITGSFTFGGRADYDLHKINSV